MNRLDTYKEKIAEVFPDAISIDGYTEEQKYSISYCITVKLEETRDIDPEDLVEIKTSMSARNLFILPSSSRYRQSEGVDIFIYIVEEK